MTRPTLHQELATRGYIVHPSPVGQRRAILRIVRAPARYRRLGPLARRTKFVCWKNAAECWQWLARLDRKVAAMCLERERRGCPDCAEARDTCPWHNPPIRMTGAERSEAERRMEYGIRIADDGRDVSPFERGTRY